MRIAFNRKEIILDADDLRSLVEQGSLMAGDQKIEFEPPSNDDFSLSIVQPDKEPWTYEHAGEKCISRSGNWSRGWSHTGQGDPPLHADNLKDLLARLLLETPDATLRFKPSPNSKAYISVSFPGDWSTGTSIAYDENGEVKSASTSESQR